MRILAIDFGKKKVGLAYADSLLAEPYSVIRYEKEPFLFQKIQKIVEKEKVEEVLVGVSEGKIAEESVAFGNRLSEFLKIKIKFTDETLSTQEAQELSIATGVNRKKRKKMEDAYSATIILQRYLDFEKEI